MYTQLYIFTLSILCMLQSFFARSCPLFCNCDSEGIRMTCLANSDMEAKQILQMSLPYNASSLRVLFSSNVTQVNISLCTNVTETSLIELYLEGHENISPWALEKKHVTCFGKLRVFQLCDMSMISIQTGTLSDMFYLEVFDVSRNRDLEIDDVIAAFQNSTVPKLRTFNISLIHSRKGTDTIVIGHAFFNIFKETELKILDFSWTRTSLLTVPVAYYIPKIEVINMTGTFLEGNSACMSSTLRLENLRHLECNNWPYLVKSKRSARSIVYPSCNSSYAGVYVTDSCYNLPTGLKVLYLQNININFFFVYFSKQICFNPSNVLKFLSFRGLVWSSERPFSVIKGFIRLETFDMSGMGISIISPDTFRYMPSLKNLDLSSNNLYEIDVTMLVFNRDLTVLDLSRNKLDNFPWTIVTNNSMLETLNLSLNSLKSFKVNFRRNFTLAIIDVSHNNLKTLDLSEFYYKEKTINETLTVINITNTSIVCDCSTDSKRYFEWFLGSRNNSRIQPYPDVGTCGHYDLREPTSYSSYRDIMVDKCKIAENNLTLAISLPISIGIIIIGCIAGLVFYKVRRKINKNRPVFISAANEDLHGFVMKTLLPRLKEELIKKRPFNCKIEVMPFITGFDMRPGENIEDQMQSFIKESLCVIAIISENFLGSPYCSRELEIAQQLQRKIIPLCIDNCKQKINDVTTHKVIKDVMQKYAYIQWPLVADTEHVIQENENYIEDYQHGIGDNHNVNVREEDQIEIVIDGNQTQNVMKDNPTKKTIKLLVESIRRTYLYSIPR